MTFTNLPKNATSFSNTAIEQGRAFWESSVSTWADTQTTWAESFADDFVLVAKTSSSFVNQTKN
jgi:hypothetical protein